MNEQTRNTLLVGSVGFMCGIILLLGIVSVVAPEVRADHRWEQRIAGLEKKIETLDQKMATLASGRRDAGNGAPSGEDYSKVYRLDVGPTPVMGKKDAPVMITMFADFQCPFCARFYWPLKEAMSAYPDKVRFMIKNMPLSFHPNALPAAKAALAAGLQGKYFEMADLIMKNRADVSEAKLKEYATVLGLDADRLLKDLQSKDAQFDKQIDADKDLAQRSDVRGTPTFFLNGRKTGAHDLNAWKAAIDKALSGK